MRDYFGYNVLLTMNITDIDDKIIIRSRGKTYIPFSAYSNFLLERGIEFLELTKQYEREYMEDMANLNVEAPDILTRVRKLVPIVIIS